MIPPRAQQNANKSRAKQVAVAIAVTLFLMAWLSGMTAGLTASACRSDRYEKAQKLRFCSISRVAGAWMDIMPLERAKRSIIVLERGLAMVQLGKMDKARDDFEKALQDARSKPGAAGRPGYWEIGLHTRMTRLGNPEALAIWGSVLADAGARP